MKDLNISASDRELEDKAIWSSLEKAIAKSSGFQSWQQERKINTDEAIEIRVRRYLEETLETLAY
jgi:hypothetical protein